MASDAVIRFMVKELAQTATIGLVLYGAPKLGFPPGLIVAAAVAAGAGLGLAVWWYETWAGRIAGLPWYRIGLRLSMLVLAGAAVAALFLVHVVAGMLATTIVVRAVAPIIVAAVHRRRQVTPVPPIPRPRAGTPARAPAER